MIVQIESVQWDKLGIVGTTVVAIITVVTLFLRHLSEQRAHEATQRKEFTDALATLTKQFGDRVEHIAGAVTASNERVETAMRDLAIEMRGNTPHGAQKK